jgi:hypothetical protein
MFKRTSFLAAALVTAAVAAPPAMAANAPVGVWNLDEGSGTRVADSSGNGNNGVLSGGASWVSGVFGSALSFDGTGQVKVSDNLVLEPNATVTVSAWVNSATSPGLFRYVIAKGAYGCMAASYGLYSGPNGGLEFYVSKSRGSVYAASPDAGQGIWDGKWHLAVGTYDGSTIRLYVDGVQVGSGTLWPGALEYLLPNSNDFYIGNYPGCPDHEFVGAIDAVNVWNRTLGATEIAGLMPANNDPPGQPTSPTGGGSGTQGGGSGGAHTTGGGSGGSTKPKDPAPSIHGVKLSSSTITVDTHGNVISQGTSGLSLTYTEAEAASLTLTLLRSEKGVRRGTTCVAPPRRGHGRRCTRFVVISSVQHADRAGRLTVKLSQLFHRRLTPGTYRLDVTPRANGVVGKTLSVRLVVRRSRAHH